jgi:hypothetical protein
MTEFAPEKTWLPIEERMATEKNPRIRANLEEVRDHMRSEIQGDHAALMATLTDDPSYHMWGTPVESGPKGRDNVSVFYEGMIASGGNRFHFAVDRIVADEDAVVTEGRMRTLMPGIAIKGAGVETVDGQPVDDAAEYVAEWQILTVWPIAENGKIIGEDIYFGSNPMQSISRRAP